MSSIRDEEVKDFKVGDVFYECEYGATIKARVLSEPVKTGEDITGRKQWRWQAENLATGDTIDYLITEGFSHYGPHLYREPIYALSQPEQSQ